MKQRKIPLRMCVVTRERFEKRELLRIVRTPNGEVVVDLTGRENGKGAYLKKDVSVIEKARKNKILDKALEISVPDSLYNEIVEIIEKEGEAK